MFLCHFLVNYPFKPYLNIYKLYNDNQKASKYFRMYHLNLKKTKTFHKKIFFVKSCTIHMLWFTSKYLKNTFR